MNTNITVVDTSGHNNEKRSPRPTSNQKRASISIRIDQCPDLEYPYFIRSTCDHTSGSLNAQSYKLTCNSRPMGSPTYNHLNDDIISGSCGSTEFCVQNDHNAGVDHVAHCVSTENVVNLVTAGSGPASGARRVTFDTTTGAGHDLVGQVLEITVLTGDARSVVEADSISMSALAKDTINGQDSYRAQVGGTTACTGCSSIQLAKVPDNTARMQLDISFHGVSSGAGLDIVHFPIP